MTKCIDYSNKSFNFIPMQFYSFQFRSFWALKMQSEVLEYAKRRCQTYLLEMALKGISSHRKYYGF